MPKVAVQVTSEGVSVPARVLEEAGVGPGDVVEIEVATLPSAKEIQFRALRHTIWKLGDAIRVGSPRWLDGEWMVELWSSDETERIGRLFLDPRGEVLPEKSTSRETLG